MITLNALKNELNNGVSKLGLNLGIVSKIDGEMYKVITCTENEVGVLPESHFELAQTYCADVIKTRKTRFYTDVAEITEMLKHPCFLNIQLRAYIGTPIFHAGEIWGTLNYSSRRPREDHYDEKEIEFLEYQARRVGSLIASY